MGNKDDKHAQSEEEEDEKITMSETERRYRFQMGNRGERMQGANVLSLKEMTGDIRNFEKLYELADSNVRNEMNPETKDEKYLYQKMVSEFKSDLEYQKDWIASTLVYQQNRKYFSSNVPVGHYIGITCYTTPAFEGLNTKLRSLIPTKWEDFQYKNFWFFLSHALEYFSDLKNDPKLIKDKPLYAGLKRRLNTDGFREGDTFIFNQFRSTSIDYHVAHEFSGYGKGSMLFLHGKPEASLGVNPYAFFGNEEEILIWPWSRYEFWYHDEEKDEIHLKSAEYRGETSGILPYTP